MKSQADIALYLGLSQSYVSKVKNNKFINSMEKY